jgi:hypothetical protein
MATKKHVFVSLSAVIVGVTAVAVLGTVQAHEGETHEAVRLTASDVQPTARIVLQGNAIDTIRLQPAQNHMQLQPAGSGLLLQDTQSPIAE